MTLGCKLASTYVATVSHMTTQITIAKNVPWWQQELNIAHGTCRRRKYVVTHLTHGKVLFSSQWISTSSDSQSSVSTPRRQRTTSDYLSGRDRSGWKRDMRCTTRHLCTSQRTSPRHAHRCPGLECWTCVHDERLKSHLQTAGKHWHNSWILHSC